MIHAGGLGSTAVPLIGSGVLLIVSWQKPKHLFSRCDAYNGGVTDRSKGGFNTTEEAGTKPDV